MFSKKNNEKKFKEYLNSVKKIKVNSEASDSQKTEEGMRRRLPFWGFIKVLVFFSTILFLIFIFVQDKLPDVKNFESYSRLPCLEIQDCEGKLLGSYGDLYDTQIDSKDLPNHVKQALIAIEDRRFYHHFGVDFLGLLRAMRVNFMHGKVKQGASTITQQLAKNFLVNKGKFNFHDRSLSRKIQEAILAILIEYNLKKDDILTIYFNRVYFGGGTFGIEAASRKYFEKSSKDLTVFESAIIAGLLKAPSRYSPTHNVKRAIERATLVLKAMEEEKFIDDYKLIAKNGTDEFLKFVKNKKKDIDQYFSDWVYETLPDVIGTVDEDLIIKTTIDSDIQRIAKKAAFEEFIKLREKFNVHQLAMIVMTPEGAVKAMIGGINYQANQFNRATKSIRQPGSAFKPFVYLAAIEKGYSVDTIVSDYPPTVAGWSPKNFKWTSQGGVSMLVGFARSINAVAVRLTQSIGYRNVIKVAKRLGITSSLPDNLTVCLGTGDTTLLEMTRAYAPFSNGGYTINAFGVDEIYRKSDKKRIFQRKPGRGEKVIEDKHLSQMLDLMRASVEFGTSRASNVGPGIHAKTGSNGNRDAWYFGFNLDEDYPAREVVVGIWAGNDNNESMHPMSTGGRLPARIAKTFFTQYFEFLNNNPKKEEEIEKSLKLDDIYENKDENDINDDQQDDAPESNANNDKKDDMQDKTDDKQDKADHAQDKSNDKKDKIANNKATYAKNDQDNLEIIDEESTKMDDFINTNVPPEVQDNE